MIEIKSARDLKNAQIVILAAGPTGTGKSTQFLTLPGKKYVDIFDPNALIAYEGQDVDYQTFFPKSNQIDIYPTSIHKSTAGKYKRHHDQSKVKGYEADGTFYNSFADNFVERANTDFYRKNGYSWLSLDGFTNAAALAMDRVTFLNESMESADDRADFRMAGQMLSRLARMSWGLGVNLYLQCHTVEETNENGQVLAYKLNLPGSARSVIPTNTANVWFFDTDIDRQTKKVSYKIITQRSRKYPFVRSGFKNLKDEEDITIDFSKPLEGQGIGKLIKNRS